MDLDPGQLTERITLQARAAGKDVHGQPNGAWTDVTGATDIWARRRLLSAREFFAAAQTQNEGVVEYVIRVQAVSTAWRLVWNGQNHDIVSADSPDRTWTVIMARAGVADGR
jgi:SPP1 family predicted phage head-tail adaptor